ncbi:Hypothetical protein SRAE_1000021900 [Strongyloides ratti]|uniref:Uncharacterized protein n=1 Tax=Strongyloides ratti TaxID=34506 RepID=A0A090MU26_STRRB|nr:Hypothetical protein SRAE_1000021900 [Strongyloides ratti]CEF61943.1 Hypothetical protein SRAE_1000021900 [Strongyloides ratti]
MAEGRARAGNDMFITCNVGCKPKTNLKSGNNLICVRESFQGISCRTQKKYGCGVGEHTLKDYTGEIVSSALTQGCFSEKDEIILKKQNVDIIKMNNEGEMKLDTGKRFMIINGKRCNENNCNIFAD